MNEIKYGKYANDGAYHYRATVGARRWRSFNVFLAARYLTAVRLLTCSPGDVVLDAGSGEGVASILLAQHQLRVIAVDADSDACHLGAEIVRTEAQGHPTPQFVRSNVYSLPFADETFDGAVSLEVIEHIPDVQAYLKELRRVMKSGSTIVFSTPLQRKDGELQDPFHVREYTHESLSRTLNLAFSDVGLFSAWSAERQATYRRKGLLAPLWRLRRGFIKYRSFRGHNPFVGPIKPDLGSPLILARALK